MGLEKTLDYTALAITTFFLADTPVPGDILKARPSLLWLYFSTPHLRSIVYAGFAGKIILDSINRGSLVHYLHGPLLSSKISTFLTLSFLSVTAFVNLVPKNWLWPEVRKGQDPSERGTWKLSATDSTGWLGAWWFGFGNGEWFAFLGHNGDHDKILPSVFLDQMAVYKTDSQNSTIIIEEE